MQAPSGTPLVIRLSSSAPKASQAAQAQADAQERLDQSQSLNLALRQPRFSSTIPHTIPPDPIPQVPTPIEQFRPDAHPADPIRTQHQRRMMDAFIARQRLGLREEIVEEARRRWNSSGNSPTSSWKSIIDESVDKTCYTLQLLTQLPDCIIKSLIRNTLAFDYANDPNVQMFVSRHMRTSTAYAGIYVNIIRRGLPTGSLALSGTMGKGDFLSCEEAEKLIKRVERYIANKPADYTVNTRVDNYFKTAKTPDSSERKFNPTNARWPEWLDQFRSIYCNNVPASERSTRFKRCPMEVGWSQDIPKRLKAHRENGNTTNIFGVVNAMTRQPAAQEGFSFPEVWQLALFPVWKRDPRLARVAEAVASILCSSYWCYGGLNITEAGYSNITMATPDFDNVLWEESVREAHGRLYEAGLADEEWQYWLDAHRMVEARKELPGSKIKYDHAKAISADASAKRAELRLNRQKTNEKRDQIDNEIKAQRELNAIQQGRKDEGQDDVAINFRLWEDMHRDKLRRDEELDQLLDLFPETRPRVDESTLSEATKTFLARVDARSEKAKAAWVKKQEAKKARQSTASTQDNLTHDGSQD